MAASKQNLIRDWADANVGETFSTVTLAKQLGISLPTLLTYLKAHSAQFAKASHGWYTVLSTEANATHPLGGMDIDDPSGVVDDPFGPGPVTLADGTVLHYDGNGPIPFPAQPTSTSVPVSVISTEPSKIDDPDPQPLSEAQRPFEW